MLFNVMLYLLIEHCSVRDLMHGAVVEIWLK